MGLRQNEVDNVQMLEYFISHHPAYYGLKNFDKFSELMGVQQNITDGLMKLAINQKKNRNENIPNTFVHPLYVHLQKQSPMGMMKDFNVSEVDWKQSPIGKHEFYQNYLSKSLPLVLRHAFEHTKFYQEAQVDHEKFL